VVATALLPALGGCAAGLDLAVIGAASQAAGTGSAVFSAGKIKAVGLVDVESARRAVYAAAADTSLTIDEESSPREDKYRIVLKDERNEKIYVYVERRTETMTRVQINVGYFGNEPTARLLLKRIGIALDAQFSDEG
jgi:hypothetical protein